MRLSWLVGVAAMGLPAVAQAHTRFSIGVGFGLSAGFGPSYGCYSPYRWGPRYYYAPAPPVVYYAPPPVYAEPAQVYAAPPVTYSAPAVVYAPPSVVYAAPPVVYAAPGPYVSVSVFGRGEPRRYYRSATRYSYRR